MEMIKRWELLYLEIHLLSNEINTSVIFQGRLLKFREACLHRHSPQYRYNLYSTSASLRLEGVKPSKSVFT